MRPMMWALLPVCILATPALAQPPANDEQPATATPAQADVMSAKPCKAKKKGLGGVLRAARSSGLIAVAAGKAGTGGALVNSVTNTAIDVADTAKHMAPPEQPAC